MTEMTSFSDLSLALHGRENLVPALATSLAANPTLQTLTEFDLSHTIDISKVSNWLIEMNRIQSIIDLKYQELKNTGVKDSGGRLVVDVLGALVSIGFFTFSRTYSGGEIHYDGDTKKAYVIYGSIYSKWLQLGGLSYGSCITDELVTPDGVGRFNHFSDGKSIYWTSQLGSFAIYGSIRAKWASMGWERSFLGYPVTDELGTPDGIGRYNHFQNGSIYAHPTLGTYEIHGGIREKWASLGWENSSLGYPVSDQTVAPDGVGYISNFERGTIYWSANTGCFIWTGTMTFENRINFDNGIALGGTLKLIVSSNGDYSFQGHMHDSGFDGYWYSIGAVLVTRQGMAYTFERKGSVEGTVNGLPFGRPDRDDDWINSGNNQSIKSHWADIASGQFSWKAYAKDSLVGGIERIINEALEELKKKGAQIAINAIIGVVAA